MSWFQFLLHFIHPLTSQSHLSFLFPFLSIPDVFSFVLFSVVMFPFHHSPLKIFLSLFNSTSYTLFCSSSYSAAAYLSIYLSLLSVPHRIVSLFFFFHSIPSKYPVRFLPHPVHLSFRPPIHIHTLSLSVHSPPSLLVHEPSQSQLAWTFASLSFRFSGHLSPLQFTFLFDFHWNLEPTSHNAWNSIPSTPTHTDSL